jgi:DNA-directed RNA polymerase subunit RPC12/RpoP
MTQRMMNAQPTCPLCKQTFQIPSIAGGYVRCPHCETPMFQYRYDDDQDMTPQKFMGLLYPRANEAITNSRHWFNGGGVIQSGKAAAFVVRLWPTLAQVFLPEPEPEDVA